jgi:hypothetical protein
MLPLFVRELTLRGAHGTSSLGQERTLWRGDGALTPARFSPSFEIKEGS